MPLLHVLWLQQLARATHSFDEQRHNKSHCIAGCTATTTTATKDDNPIVHVQRRRILSLPAVLYVHCDSFDTSSTVENVPGGQLVYPNVAHYLQDRDNVFFEVDRALFADASAARYADVDCRSFILCGVVCRSGQHFVAMAFDWRDAVQSGSPSALVYDDLHNFGAVSRKRSAAAVALAARASGAPMLAVYVRRDAVPASIRSALSDEV